MSKLYKMIHCPVCCCCTVMREGETYTCAACDEQWQMITSEDSKLTSDVSKLTPMQRLVDDLVWLREVRGKPVLDEKTQEDLLENDDSFFN